MSNDLASRFRPTVLGSPEMAEFISESGLYNLKGQNGVSRQLEKFFLSDYLPQVFCLQGPKGVGKTSTARIFAKMVNCLEPAGPAGKKIHPCNQCTSCESINNFNFSDVVEVNGSDNTGVDDARRLIESAAYMPAVGKAKVYVIDECHYLSRNAWNSLLKILEDTPENVYFLLVTTEPHRIPDTIHSRAHALRFRVLSIPDLKEVVKGICGCFLDSSLQDKEAVDKAIDDLATAIAVHANGSARDAVKLYERVVGEGAITPETIYKAIDFIGMASRDFIQNLVLAMINEDYHTVMTLVEQAEALEFSFARVCGFMSDFFMELAIAQKIGSLIFCDLFKEFIESNVEVLKPIDSVSVFFKIFDLEKKLSTKNDKNLFLAGLFNLLRR